MGGKKTLLSCKQMNPQLSGILENIFLNNPYIKEEITKIFGNYEL